MPLDEALRKAREDLRGANPVLVANRAGVTYAAGEFAVPFFDRAWRVQPQTGEVREGERALSDWLQLLALHYLATADGALLADDWISFRQLPGGLMYQSAFTTRAIQPLAAAFGQDVDGFGRAARSLNGLGLSRFGDGAFRFLAFPRLPLACLLWLADDELPASADILFDRAAPHYLPTEDLSAVGGYLSRTLIQRR